MKLSLKKVRTAHGVEEYKLSNGLRLLYKREPAAPVVAVCVTYHVGSRNEAAGHTGSTHILEHLMFKNSEQFKKGEAGVFSDYIEWKGALWNATTWLDRTNYFEMLPAEHLEDALRGEADRMRNSQFTDADLASEMTVVRNEYERGRNNPFELLDEAVMEAVYTKHPYRIPTIGTKEDIEHSTATKLREFYDTFYWPNNATLMVVGDVSLAQVTKLALKHFGPIPSSPHAIPQLKVVEPKQTKPRKVAMHKPMGVSIASLYFKICPAKEKEFPAVLALASILGGGFSSRLQRALVDTGLAADVSAHAFALHDPGILSITAHVAEGAAPAGVLTALRREVRMLAKTGVTKEELDRAKERILSEGSAERDGALNQVRTVSEALAAGDWTLAYRLEHEVSKLKSQDIVRVAKKYLSAGSETSGILINK